MRATRKSTTAGCIALVLAIAAGGCGKMQQSDPRKDVKTQAQAKRQKAACGSSTAYSRLKGLLFDQAAEEHSGNPNNLDTLADYSFLRIEEPVVKSWDPALDVISCRGHLVLEIPSGAEQAFAGERHLQTDVNYTAQAAADGSGFVYRLAGAEPIVDRLATFNLTNVAYRPSPAIDEQQDKPVVSEPTRPVRENGLTPQPLPRTRPLPTSAEGLPPAARKGATPPTAAEMATREPAPRQAADEPKLLPQDPSVAHSGEASIRAFYVALGTGDGARASAQVVPEKQSSRAFSPEAISRFYGRLPEPLQLTALTRVGRGDYRVSYRYSAGRSRCNGSAIVSVTRRGNRDYIRSIRALSDC